MTTTSTCPPAGCLCLHAVKPRAWVSRCEASGCPNKLRVRDGDPYRPHCAEHVSPSEMQRFYAAPASQLDSALFFALTFKLVPLPLQVSA